MPNPNINDLIAQLSGISVSQRDRSRAATVAGHLVESVLRERWHALSIRDRLQLVRPSTNRLWNSYMHNRLKRSPKEAAKQAIEDELTLLGQVLNSN